MKILVTGAGGQLGFDVTKECQRRGFSVWGATRQDFSLTDTAKMEEQVRRFSPEAVIHCAAYTAVDKAEDEKETAYAVNAMATRNLAVICRDLGAKFIYISTDYVFPGKGEKFYEPEDAKEPLNAYGASKLAGEEAVQEMLTNYFIVRISWVFGRNGKNFIRTMLNLSETHNEIKVVADQIGSPTYTKDLAPLLLDMAASDKYGVYHATNEGVCSWATLAAEVFRQAGRRTKVIEVPTAAYPTKATRPLNSRLSKACLDEAGFQRLPDWRDAVRRYLSELREAR
ncbi:MAG: dTDP-4-dehydrorhamnose reductase [Selenomonadaceae bacterium]|nr:dTDP-4-dehydrorhamnose reductase [Selenomonadaceae bacterium]